ncbi:MAG TPA: hypothetical protein VHV83_15760 [Armatimonadota bacterium]|nr:hypothetical protein [Armatimonadota bacterium]
MRISYTARTIYDGLFLALDGIYDGTAFQIVMAMKHSSVFGEDVTFTYYLQFHAERLLRVHGITTTIPEAGPEEQAATFLATLLTHGLAFSLPDEPERNIR